MRQGWRSCVVVAALTGFGMTAMADAPVYKSLDPGMLGPVEFEGLALPKPKPYNPVDPGSAVSIHATTSIPKLGDFDIDQADMTNRQFMRDFFNAIYMTSEETPIQFTGDVSTCSPGTTSQLFKDATNLRINYHRGMAGIPDNITFNPTNSAKSQEAAVIMSANNQLSHFPPTNWTCYTADGDEAAQSSNLSLGNNGWDAVSRGQMRDNGANNTAVGHRRWLLHPPTEMMGTGDVPAGGGFNKANSIWVFDNNTFGSAPLRDGFVAWPPPGFVPFQATYPRWSFGLEGADFSGATVTMFQGGNNVPVTVESLVGNIGLNTIVWYPDTLNPNNQLEAWPRPSADETYSVSISNVMVGGSPQSFNYQVTVFDPGVPGAGALVPTISGPASVTTSNAASFSFSNIGHAQDYTLRESTLAPFTAVEGAESGLADVTDGTDTDYPLISNGVSGTGGASFHLAHPNAASQWFVWERAALVTGSSQLTFQSRLGWSTSDQTAKAQVSLNDGATWTDVYSQAGTGGSGESSFTNRSISLASFAGKVVKVRFSYEFNGGSYFNATSNGVGFYVDQIAITNAQEVTVQAETDLGNVSSFNFTAGTDGAHLLQVRYVPWSGFPGSDWGPGFEVQATAGSGNAAAVNASVLPTTRSGRVGVPVPAFATIANAGSVDATNCSISPITSVPGSFSYQQTDPLTNALMGTPNTPVNIPVGAFQSYVFSFTPSAPFAPTDVHLSFDCANSGPAGVFSGLNTLLLSASATPVPDIIALVAAPGGIVSIPDTGFGVFVAAVSNVGSAGEITVYGQSGSSGAPLNILVCQTDPVTSVCLADPAASVTLTIDAGGTPTFGFFVSRAGGPVAFDPANNRAVVIFEDAGGVTRGSSGVAACSTGLCP